MDDSEEFQKVKAGIVAAADVLTKAIEQEAKGPWDFLIVAVPMQRKTTQVGIMASMPAEQIPYFLSYLLAQYRLNVANGTIIDDRKPEGQPS